MICACYFIENLPIFTDEDLTHHMLMQKICETFNLGKRIDYDEAVFINVSHDKMLIPAYGESSDECIGNNVITDRHKLYRFLRILNNSHTYKYVFFNIGLCGDGNVLYNDSLLLLLHRMDRIAFVRNNRLQEYIEMSDKAISSEYYSTITTTGFVRYEYMDSKGYSMPLKVYEDLYPEKRMRKWGFHKLSFYFMQNHLCQNSCFLTFDSNIFSEYDDAVDKLGKYVRRKNYYNLGAEFVNPIDESVYTEDEMTEMLARLTNGKYVVIGNMEEDLEDTYMGQKPASLILFRAFQSLEEGRNLVRFGQVFFWFIIYFIISFFICREKTILSYVPCVREAHYKLLYYIVDLLSFSTFLFGCQLVEYIWCLKVRSIIIPIIYFSTLKMKYNYEKF